MTAHKQSHPNQPTGLKGQICDVVKAAGKPLITKKIAVTFSGPTLSNGEFGNECTRPSRLAP